MPASLLPLAVFQVLPSLYPYFSRLLESHHLTFPEFFVLSFIRNCGHPIEGKPAVLTSRLTEELRRVFGYKSQSRPTTVITELVKRGLVIKRTVRPTELFKEASGKNLPVVLQAAGRHKLDEFNEEIDRFIQDLTADVPKPLLKLGLRRLEMYIIPKLDAFFQSHPVHDWSPRAQ